MANILGGADVNLTESGYTYGVNGVPVAAGANSVKIQAANKHTREEASCLSCVVNCTEFTTENGYIYFVKGTDDYSWSLGASANTALSPKL